MLLIYFYKKKHHTKYTLSKTTHSSKMTILVMATWIAGMGDDPTTVHSLSNPGLRYCLACIVSAPGCIDFESAIDGYI